MAPAERRAGDRRRGTVRRDRGQARARRARLRARRAEPARDGTTRADWRDGDIPVVPYPVDDAPLEVRLLLRRTRSGFRSPSSRSRARRCGRRSSTCRSGSVGAGAKRRWLVDSWSPRGGGGGGRGPSRVRGLAVPGRPAPRAERVDQPRRRLAARPGGAGRARAARPGRAPRRSSASAPAARRRRTTPRGSLSVLELELEPVVGELDAAAAPSRSTGRCVSSDAQRARVGRGLRRPRRARGDRASGPS